MITEKQRTEYANKLIQICKNEFPNEHNPEFSDLIPQNDCDIYTYCVSWKLNNDPKRPNKRSRGIQLVFTREDLDDAIDSNVSAETFKQQIRRIIKSNYNSFNPEHDHPPEIPPPKNQWLIKLK